MGTANELTKVLITSASGLVDAAEALGGASDEASMRAAAALREAEEKVRAALRALGALPNAAR